MRKLQTENTNMAFCVGVHLSNTFEKIGISDEVFTNLWTFDLREHVDSNTIYKVLPKFAVTEWLLTNIR